MKDLKESYNELPYFSSAFPECSPIRLEALASFLSFNPTDSSKANVLEIGCSYGGNLFPFAASNPEAKVVGIDLSEVQIEKAKEIAAKMRLENIKFMAKDICELSDDDVREFGKFDYIICHGVYSWVPDFVKEAILKTIKKLLSPNGITYISYNVYPGWKTKDTIRDFLLFVTKDIDSQQDKIVKARESLKMLGEYAKFCKQDGNVSQIAVNYDSLEFHINNLLKADDSYIAHEYLEAFNHPIYFKDFADTLEKNGLSYIAEVELDDVFRSELGVGEFDNYINANFNNRIDKEQILDFMTNRVFRRSMITHKELIGDDFHVDIGPTELAKLHLSVMFSKNSDGNYINHIESVMKPQYNWLYQVFTNVYPASINFADVAALLKDDENSVTSAYFGFMEILATGYAKASVYPRPAIDYEVGKTRLKEQAKKYLTYFVDEPNPVISSADEINSLLGFSQVDAFTALKFDGKNSIDDIIKQIDHFVKKNNLNFMENNKVIKTNSKSSMQKTLKDYVLMIKADLRNANFFENF